jgi:8-amino-7-oxononanoate synthase
METATTTPNDMLHCWIKAQKLRAPAMENASAFYRNLEAALDIRRRDHGAYTIKPNLWRESDAIDFGSNDAISLGTSGMLRTEFENELRQQPFGLFGTCSSRAMDGNYHYLEKVEQEIADFHGADTGLIVGSGFQANLGIFAAIPQPGDVIVYDELVHASTLDGIQNAPVMASMPFAHSDVDSFRDVMLSVHDSYPRIRQGKGCVLVTTECLHGMYGDICPLADLVRVADEIFPGGNAQFIVDEAHSTGVIGPNGAGLVSELGLESKIAVRLHTFGKSLAGTGGLEAYPLFRPHVNILTGSSYHPR